MSRANREEEEEEEKERGGEGRREEERGGGASTEKGKEIKANRTEKKEVPCLPRTCCPERHRHRRAK